MEEELNKPTFKPKFKSEFSMGEYDFKRFDKWLDRADLSSAKINSCESPDVQDMSNYFAELNILYKYWRALISMPQIIIELDSAFNESKRFKRTWEESIKSGLETNKKFIKDFVDKLDSIHTKLLDIKQKIGLGIIVKRSMSTKEKIRYGIRPRTDMSDLPEA